jgi:ABC-type Fe3+-siderophore transport system permease subunit
VGSAAGSLLGDLFNTRIIDIGFLGIYLGSVASIVLLAFVLSLGVGAGFEGVNSNDPIALGSGVGGLPLIGSVLSLLSLPANDHLFIGLALFGIALSQMLGGYLGCRRLQAPKPQPQRGIGDTCANCNYNLSATPDHQPCPECGRMYRLSNTPPSAAPPEGP